MSSHLSSSRPSESLEIYGWDAAWAAARDRVDPTLLPARVTRVDRGLWTAMSERGVERVGLSGDLLDRTANDPVSVPCVGDWVLLRAWPDERTTLDHVLPRRTAIVRASAGSRSDGQALAANADIAAVVSGLDQDPSISKIERLLALAWESGAAPMVLLTKADMAADAPEVAADVVVAAPGVDVIVCSTVDGRGMDAIAECLGTGTIALLGSSGVGKSTLVNTLVGAEVLTTQAIRADGRGRHTSVRRELVVLPHGGCVIDTPGLRGVGMAADGHGIAAAFADVEELISQCRFNDCTHESEPGCAVQGALDSEDLAPRRYESWRKLQREAAWQARRADARLRAAELRIWKRRTKDVRARTRRD